MKRNRTVILMLGGARRVSMAELLMKSAARLGHELEILSYELTNQVPIAAVGEVIVGLKWTDSGVEDHIVKICREKEVNIILPFVDGAIEIAAKCAALMPDVFVPVSESNVAAMMFDKVEAAKAFRDAEIPIPETYTVLTASIPAIAKPRRGSASRGIKVFRNMEDLMQLQNINDYIIQEYISHRKEYTVDCYVDMQGEVLCTVPRLREEVMGGEVTRTRTVKSDILEQMCRKVINAFKLRGPVTLQFIHDLERDRFLLMEVNPRLGGGVICSIYAGAPIADYILQESLGVPLTPCSDWTNNTLMARYWKEVIFYDN
ncbi:MAG: ATP-grasp domain-containing protein [Prevotella sp.]|nr:ATP-grasp domain-containing protein [Prevotella sp.]MCM1075446.1 ATP-grasp domain-containing protein [Ruminococcus sp.]